MGSLAFLLFRGVSLNPDALPARRRLTIAILVGVAAAAAMLALATLSDSLRLGGSDFDQLWYAARSIWRGGNPYQEIGAGRAYEWPVPHTYPLTTDVAALTLAWLPVLVARALFVALCAGMLAYALGGSGFVLFPLFLSAAFVESMQAAQMAPLITAAILLPACGWAFALKPNLGALLTLAVPKPLPLFLAAATGIVLLLGTIPSGLGWIQEWTRLAFGAAYHKIPVMGWGGPLLLLPLLRWRRLESRVILAMACVPHTPVVYDVLPLGLTARTAREAWAFTALTHVANVLQQKYAYAIGGVDPAEVSSRILNLVVYLPCALAVLMRPNEGAEPFWVDWLRRWRPARTPNAS